MSLPIAHMSIGMGFAFFVSLILYLKRRLTATKRMLILVPCLMLICGLWAMGPDFLRFTDYPRPHNFVYEHPVLADVFFFHGFLDRHEAEDQGVLWGLLLFLAVFYGSFLACIRHIKGQQRELNALRREHQRVKDRLSELQEEKSP